MSGIQGFSGADKKIVAHFPKGKG